MVQEVYARSPWIKTVFGTQQVRLTLTNDAWKKFHVIVEDLINEKQWHYSYITRRAAEKRYTATVAELQSYVLDVHRHQVTGPVNVQEVERELHKM